MPRLSFRAILLLGFLLVAGILSTITVSGWLSIEALAHRIHDENHTALTLSAATARLSERSVDLERAARQFIVLGDHALVERFQVALDDAQITIATLESSAGSPSGPLAAWREAAMRIHRTILAGQGDAPMPLLDEDFTALSVQATALDRQLRAHLAQRNQALLQALDAARDSVILQIAIALTVSALLAAASAWWLLRPLVRIEQAIGALGENRLSEPIRIAGPADLRQLGERLDWLRLRLAELEANRNRVLRHVSHELKTPLASLREGIALLSDGVLGELDARQREVASILEHSTQALQSRIEQLLQYNASQFDARRLDLRDTALLPLLREVGAEQRLLAESREVSIHVRGDAPAVRADAGKLRIAFANLLANAIAFSPMGGRIELLAGRDGERVIVDCLDEGPGIDPDELERVFEPFYQGRHNPPAPVQGNGIGLAIVREFVTAHQGRVRALPSACGAHFRIELPYA
ncbi:MAG: HAMP domain-containing sensor histidine kinase [Thauera sp.]|jgi:two-component system sensor histidine kinase GlrK|nr:HAMP domain-containing sensor histidine kinase [Thauera sp.]